MRPICLLGVLVGCVVARQPLTIPPDDQTTILLVTGQLGPPLRDIARHPWLAVRRAHQRGWTIYEVPRICECGDDPFRGQGYFDPLLHAVWRGPEADRAADCLAREAPGIIEDIGAHYLLYPGPNSNTFGDLALRRCGLHASLPGTSIGKDWRGWIGAGVTSEGTGVQIETPFVGLRLGLKEGIEIHVLGLPFGIDLWPPAIILPLGPGRLGFADR
ncbi:MAG TPA: DUF3750 domain-containing protein [Kofleriaceae bacterium]|nr:DUF3750 domain-containing protein [Kofleriaceae bacterium]